MSLNVQRILVFMDKDWTEIRKTKYVMMSLIVLPLVMAVVMPLSLVAPFSFMSEEDASDESLSLEALFSNVPPPTSNWDELTELQKTVVVMVYLGHIFFLIIPCVLPSVIAADSIAGEKERKSFEAILATPISDSELLVAKVGLPFILGMVGTYIATIPYVGLTVFFTYDVLGNYIVVPDLNFLLLIFLLSPAIALMTSICMVFVSSRVGSARDAQQVGALVVLPLIIVIISQIVLALFSPLAIVVGAFVFFVLDFLLFKLSLRFFSRDKIITKFS